MNLITQVYFYPQLIHCSVIMTDSIIMITLCQTCVFFDLSTASSFMGCLFYKVQIPLLYADCGLRDSCHI